MTIHCYFCDKRLQDEDGQIHGADFGGAYVCDDIDGCRDRVFDRFEAAEATSKIAQANADEAHANAVDAQTQVAELQKHIEHLNISALVLHRIGDLNLEHIMGEMQYIWDAREAMMKMINTQKDAANSR